MFVDRAKIKVESGKGGDGCVSFRREKYVPKGGPDGGNGGRGGSVVAVGDSAITTLMDFRFHVVHRAGHGEAGRGRQQTGADADDIVLRIPAGTLILDTDSGEQIADLMEGDRVVLAQGGAGGLGNEHFKSATNQTPDQFTRGELGEARDLTLELKLIADVGLIGKPNAGKSTLLSSVTRATPKIGDYPFTTLKPQLGIAELDVERRLVLADIPGLIEGASEGVGLGHRFLRHVERTRVLVHLIEFEPTDGSDAFENYLTIREELLAYSSTLAEKRELIAISKVELLGDGGGEEVERMVRAGLRLGAEVEVYPISSVTGEGLPELLAGCWRAVQAERSRLV